MRTIRHASQSCLKCGNKIDASSSANNEYLPRPGDVTVCFYCTHPMQFGAGMKLQELDLTTIPEGHVTEIRRVQQGIREHSGMGFSE